MGHGSIGAELGLCEVFRPNGNLFTDVGSSEAAYVLLPQKPKPTPEEEEKQMQEYIRVFEDNKIKFLKCSCGGDDTRWLWYIDDQLINRAEFLTGSRLRENVRRKLKNKKWMSFPPSTATGKRKRGDQGRPAAAAGPAAQSANELAEQIKRALNPWPTAAVVLLLFFEREKAALRQLVPKKMQSIEGLIQQWKIGKMINTSPEEAMKGAIEHVLESESESESGLRLREDAPILQTVSDVLSFTVVRHLDPGGSKLWERQYNSLPQNDLSAVFGLFETMYGKGPHSDHYGKHAFHVTAIAIIAGGSFGFVFRMLNAQQAKLAWCLLKNHPSVQAPLLKLGFRSFGYS
jgi:hypothetical protein